MELNDGIAKSLIRVVNLLLKDWDGAVELQPGIEDKLRQVALKEPTNSPEFLTFILKSRGRLGEAIFSSALPDHLRLTVQGLLDRQSEFRARKEGLVRSKDFEEAARCRDMQWKMKDAIQEQLAGQTLVVTIEHVEDAIDRIGWQSSS